MIFYLSNNEKINNLKDYILNYLNNNPEVKLYIGTDSQRKKGGKITYISTICFRHIGKGVHIIHKKYVGKFTKDLFSKLWKELEFSIEIANEINKYIDRNEITIDLDLNSLKKWESNVAHDAARGYVIGLGYNVRTKPYGWAASRASDHLSKRKKKRNIKIK
jgi:predicted RNase H-related nuclease YkuK (DUF458 family)